MRISEKVAICTPGRQLSPGPDHTSTLISDFQPPTMKKYISLVFPPQNLRLCIGVQLQSMGSQRVGPDWATEQWQPINNVLVASGGQ